MIRTVTRPLSCLLAQRHHHAQQETLRLDRPGGELAAEAADPLGEPGQAGPGEARGLAPAAPRPGRAGRRSGSRRRRRLPGRRRAGDPRAPAGPLSLISAMAADSPVLTRIETLVARECRTTLVAPFADGPGQGRVYLLGQVRRRRPS